MAFKELRLKMNTSYIHHAGLWVLGKWERNCLLEAYSGAERTNV